MDIIGAIGGINAFLLVLFLWARKNKTISDKILIAWVINFALYFSFYFLFERNVMESDVLWTTAWGILLVSHPAFLYIYTSSLAKKEFKFDFRIGSNFLIVIPWTITLIPFLVLSVEDKESLVYNRQSLGVELFVPMIFQLCIQLFYFIRSLIVIIQHQSRIENEFSYKLKINLNWLKLLTYSYITVLISGVLGLILVNSEIINLKVIDDLLMVVRMVLFFYMVYHGLKQRLIYSSEDLIPKRVKAHDIHIHPKPNSPKPVDDKQNEYNETINNLEKLMSDEKLFQEPELSLGEIANKLGVHAHQLSKLLNNNLDKSFFEFVNEYRVDEFKRLAANPKNKHISILGLALDAGFNSKPTFNRFFKKSTGLTPSEFRDNYKF